MACVVCRERLINDELKLFQEMKDGNIQANIITYSCLVCGLRKDGSFGKLKSSLMNSLVMVFLLML